MKLDKFTVKSQEAVQAAVALAEQLGNQEIQPLLAKANELRVLQRLFISVAPPYLANPARC